MNRTLTSLAAAVAFIGLSVAGLSLLGTPNEAPVQHAGVTALNFSAGDVPPRDSIHLIERPGKYGLGPELPGSHYAIVSNNLVRVDAMSFKILSVLRNQVEVLD